MAMKGNIVLEDVAAYVCGPLSHTQFVRATPSTSAISPLRQRANLSHAPGWHNGCLLVLWTSLQSRLTFSTTQMLSRSTSSTVQRIHPFQYSRDPTRQASQGNRSSQLTLSTDELVDAVRGLSALEPILAATKTLMGAGG